MKDNMRHPSFIIGVISFIILIMGIGLKANSYRFGDALIIGGVALGAIHWIWSIIDVYKHNDIKSRSGLLWFMLVVIIPPLGGMFYYMMSKQVKM